MWLIICFLSLKICYTDIGWILRSQLFFLQAVEYWRSWNKPSVTRCTCSLKLICSGFLCVIIIELCIIMHRALFASIYITTNVCYLFYIDFLQKRNSMVINGLPLYLFTFTYELFAVYPVNVCHVFCCYIVEDVMWYDMK